MPRLTGHGLSSIVTDIIPVGLCIANIIMNDERFNTLDQKIDALIELCATMKRENQQLRAKEHNWQSERQQLLENNKLAKTRLESVLNRLKSMEQTQSV